MSSEPVTAAEFPCLPEAAPATLVCLY